MNEIKEHGWTATRKIGMRAFVWRYGVLGWGIPTSIVWSLITASTKGFQELPILLAISLPLSPVAGFLFGWLLWTLNEWVLKRTSRAARSSVDSRC